VNAVVTTHRLTVEEFASTSLEGMWELIDGDLVETGFSAGFSGWIAGQIFARLHEHVPRTLGWVFMSGAGFILFADRATVRSPDAAVVLRDRLPGLPDGFIPMAPDLPVEVLSPSDRMADALGKVSMYLEAGVRIVWLVDPASRTVTVFRPDAAPKSLAEEDALDGGDVLPGLSIPIASIFS
jgi:Uma2 family endonuclease